MTKHSESPLARLPTPGLLLDQQRMERNIARLRQHIGRLGVGLRPHLKTSKSIDIAHRLMATPTGPATVSTLKEAEEFAAAGVHDILYAVGIAPAKLDRAVALRDRGVDLSIVVDNLDQARAVAAKCRELGSSLPTLIEIDSDGHRAGIQPGDPLLVEIARTLHAGGADPRGIMTHAGGSYDARSEAQLVAAAEQERAAAIRCAGQLRSARFCRASG